MARVAEGALDWFGDDAARTRMVFILLAFLLTAFGILMIYSASSITAMLYKESNYDTYYYFVRQAVYALAGTMAAAIVAYVDYHVWSRTMLIPIWAVTVALLLVVFIPSLGTTTNGATRWIGLGPVRIQPSEFAKVTVLLAAANLIERLYEGDTGDQMHFLLRVFTLVGIPMLLILAQPDKGTVMILGLTVLAMLVVAGMPLRWVGVMALAGLLVLVGLAMRDEYSRARILTMINPWRDEYGDGYQLIQGYYSFGSGGLFGVGLGMSRQKYSYLPMAHSDFILAVIGEEFGFVGMLCVLLAFFALIWLGLRIARLAPDLNGRLIAAGAVALIGFQLLVNACGVLGIIPLSGKPVPFLSSGGSSIVATLMLVGMVVSVSRTTQASRQSGGFTVHEGRAARRLRVIEGGAQATPEAMRAERDFSRSHTGARVSRNADGSVRINLGPSAHDRLRSRDQDRGRRR